MGAHKVTEWRIPVEVPIIPGSPEDIASPRIEHFVVEVWSDHTIRHPTSGVVVSREFWEQDHRTAMNILRTAGL
jgi:hypothetical protein